MLLGPESVSEPVEGIQTQENSDCSCESGESSVSSLTLLHVIQFALEDHQNILVIECMFGTKKGEV